MLDTLRRDVAFALRSLSRARGFTFLAVSTLALGTGVNTAIFSVINSVLVRPLPYHAPDRLLFLWTAGGDRGSLPMSPARFLDFRTEMTALSLAGISQFAVTLTDGSVPEQVDASSVSSNFFDVLGVAAKLGDTFHAGRADPRAVVLTHGLWVRRYGSDPSLVGRDVLINGSARRVVAVMPRSFTWPSVGGGGTGGPAPELWLPGAASDIPRTPADNPAENLSADRRLGILRAVGRLAAGTSVAQAQREADLVASRLSDVHPATDGGRGAILVPVRDQFLGPVTRPLHLLVAAAALLLVMACANVAALLLGRGASRRREIAIRLALGATRARVARQFLTEAMVLSVGGGVVGLWVAWQAVRWLVALAPGGVLRLSDASLDPSVLLFAALVALGAGLLSGVLPAFQVSGGSPNDDLKDGGARGSDGTQGRRVRRVLAAAQVALALMLMVGAGLLLRSFSALSSVDTGLNIGRLLTFSVTVPGGREAPAVRRTDFYEALLVRLGSLPGVTGAGAAATLPIGGDDFSTPYVVAGRPALRPGEGASAGWQVVSGQYFETIGMRVIGGRGFVAGDTPGAPGVVVVNQRLATQAWPGLDPVGRRLRLGGEPGAPLLTVVGVVSDMRHRGPAVPPRPEVYQPLAQRPFASMAVIVRTTGDPGSIVPLVRREVADMNPALAISHVASMEEHVSRALSRPRFMSALTAIFGVLAVTLAVVGVYGVISRSVAERTREIAIRMAVGASGRRVIAMITLEAAALAGAGVAVGLPAAWAAARLMADQLFGVQPGDALTYLGSAAVLMIVALTAAMVPAFRAARIDGATMLRS